MSLVGDFIKGLCRVQTGWCWLGYLASLSPSLLLKESKMSIRSLLLLSGDVKALKRKLFWFQKCKISIWELHKLDVVWGLVPTENPALGKSWITQSNLTECTGPSSVYKITYVLIFQWIRAKDIDHACWTSNWLMVLCLDHVNFISSFKQMFALKSSDLNRNEVSFMSWIKTLWNSYFCIITKQMPG